MSRTVEEKDGGLIIALAIVRTLIGLAFVVVGVAAFMRYPLFIATYTDWGIPYPEFSVFVIAAIEVVCGALLMIGGLVRPAALVLATIMVEVAITGGRITGGVYLIAPALLFAALVFYAWRSGRYGVWSPTRRPGTQ